MTRKADSAKHREKSERKRRRAVDAYTRLQRAATLTASAADAALSPFGLSASQLGVLEALQMRGPLHQQELARALGRSKAQITSIIDALEKRGAASRERHATDRRFTTVHLTEAGTQLLTEASPVREGAIVALMSALSGEQRTRMTRLCRRIIRALAPEDDDRNGDDASGEDESDDGADDGADDEARATSDGTAQDTPDDNTEALEEAPNAAESDNANEVPAQ